MELADEHARLLGVYLESRRSRVRPRDNADLRRLESEGLLIIVHNKARGHWTIGTTLKGRAALDYYRNEQARIAAERAAKRYLEGAIF